MRFLAGAAATVLALAAVAVPLAAALLLLPDLWLPSLIERRLESRLHRRVEVVGPVDLHLLAAPPALEIGGLRIANPAWADEPWFLRLRQVRVEVPWARLADLSFAPSLLSLTGPRVHLLRTRSGGVTWPRLEGGRDGGRDGGGGLPADRLRISGGMVIYRVPERGTDLAARVETHRERLTVEVTGTWRGRAVAASLAGGRPLDRMSDGGAYPLRGAVHSGALHLEIDGGLSDLTGLGGVDFALAGRGPSLAVVGALIGTSFPSSPPFSLAGRLRDIEGGWIYDDVSGTIGGSAVAGRVQVVRRAPAVPQIAVEVTSSRLRMRDAAKMVGLGDGDGGGGREAGGPLVPDVPMPAGILNRFGLRLSLHAEEAEAGPLPLGGLTIGATLDSGRLVVEPIQARLEGGGSLGGRVVLDASQGVPRASVAGTADAVGFSVPVAGATARGTFGGRLDLSGRGETLHAVLASSRGEAAIMVSGGHLSSDILGRAGLGLRDLLGLVLPAGGDRGAALHCAAASAQVNDGIARIPALVVDTGTGRLEGKGRLDLGAQTMDLALRVEPAAPQLLAVSGPLEMTGPWASPEIDPQVGETVLRALAGLGLGLVGGPLAALVPMVDLGTAGESGCGAALRGAPAPRPEPPENR